MLEQLFEKIIIKKVFVSIKEQFYLGGMQLFVLVLESSCCKQAAAGVSVCGIPCLADACLGFLRLGASAAAEQGDKVRRCSERRYCLGGQGGRELPQVGVGGLCVAVLSMRPK